MNDGGQAFPMDGAYSGYVKGMTLRDYFAAKTISCLTALWNEMTESQRKVYSGCQDNGLIFARDFPNFLAKQSYAVADAMLKAREPKKE